jgi:hypothetical protein
VPKKLGWSVVYVTAALVTDAAGGANKEVEMVWVYRRRDGLDTMRRIEALSPVALEGRVA